MMIYTQQRLTLTSAAYLCNLRGMSLLSGEPTQSRFASLLKKGSILKSKESAPVGADSLLFRVDPFSEGD